MAKKDKQNETFKPGIDVLCLACGNNYKLTEKTSCCPVCLGEVVGVAK